MASLEDLVTPFKGLHVATEDDPKRYSERYSSRTLAESETRELLRNYVTRSSQGLPSPRLLDKEHGFFERCRATFDGVAGLLGLTLQCFENMRQLACGDLSKPVILLQSPTDSQLEPYDVMIEKTRTLRYINDELWDSRRMTLADVAVIDIFPFLTEMRLKQLTEAQRNFITDKIFSITRDFLTTFTPAILISCQCATSPGNTRARFSYFDHELSHHLSSSIRGAKDGHVKCIGVGGAQIHVVQAFHPGTFLSHKRTDDNTLEKTWKKVLNSVFESHKGRSLARTVAACKIKTNIPHNKVQDEVAASVKERTSTSLINDEEDKPVENVLHSDSDAPEHDIATPISTESASISDKPAFIASAQDVEFMVQEMEKLTKSLEQLKSLFQDNSTVNDRSRTRKPAPSMHKPEDAQTSQSSEAPFLTKESVPSTSQSSEAPLPTEEPVPSTSSGQHVPFHRLNSAPSGSLNKAPTESGSRQPHRSLRSILMPEDPRQYRRNNLSSPPNGPISSTSRQRSKSVFVFSGNTQQQEPLRPILPVTPIRKPNPRADSFSPTPSLIYSVSSRGSSSPGTPLDLKNAEFTFETPSKQFSPGEHVGRKASVTSLDSDIFTAIPGAFPAD